ncbi:MAG: hypothetical protein RMZ41_020505 [Nostoc sp. DedVER02]|uniref:hypothetical protein n=1 Tax=unclassified Nostoc TaxID=2593658 RepID=UPI002AD20EA3|nr:MULTISPECIES: hypothetical protein [unclassified Nostoc]MDZ7984889.1 hypothetical protein [Nostoc sp. DedVER02]MDZ8111077.1 hypothetical protein [Nostoc sp. DedVER01b]
MEHWQFLIQEQGDRSWHILESPNLGILEGQYRVLARSSLVNTDVEVRVTHSSTHEIQPTRRIFKRSRRTNSEGLMAVIPFTYFDAGIWELRCSGDLMSDLFGKPWQYSVQIQVLSQEEKAEQRKKIESNLLEPADTVSENLDTVPAESVINLNEAIAVSTEQAIATVVPDEGNLDAVPAEPVINLDEAIAVTAEQAIATDSDPVTAVVPDEENLDAVPAESVIKLDEAIAVTAEQAIATDSNPVTTVVPDEENLDAVPAEPVINLDEAIAVSTVLELTTDSNLVTTVVPDEGNLDAVPGEPVINLDEAIAVSTVLELTTDSNLVTTVVPDEGNLDIALAEPVINLDEAIAVTAEQAIATNTNLAATVLQDKTEEDVVIDEPVSPVWLKGETAEEILQNLIDLALPTSELLPNDETEEDFPATEPPLLLTLDRDTYIARWGQALTINGRIEFKDNIHLEQAETSSPKSLRSLELGIELRSPLESKILTQVQHLPDQELPFTINTSIDIPADFESKLILADISLYGRFADVDQIIRLASQSFTITADVTELLAITAAAKPSTSNDPIALSDSPDAFTEPETTVRIDLKLFNLVKIPKTDQSQILNPSPNTALPPQINLQVLRENTLRTSKNSGTSPQLPKLPPVKIDVNPPTDVVAESPTEEELLKKDITIPAINLEQLAIKQRRMPILDTTFPYLKRVQALPDEAEEVKNNVPPDQLEIQASEDIPQLDVIVAEDKNTPELVVDDARSQEEFVTEVETQPNVPSQEESVAEVETQPNSQIIATSNLYSSPLLRKWMQSQGYSLPESINEIEPQDKDSYAPAQKTQLLLSAGTPDVDVNLPLSLDADTGRQEEAQESVFELGNFEEEADTAKEADLEAVENTVVEKVFEPALSTALVRQLPPPPPPIKVNIASAWLAQEIVVDDTDSELEADATNNYSLEEETQPLLGLSSSRSITAGAIEPLPIPQLHVPEGELIANKFIIVRVVLPEVPPQVVVKLWVEDCQTRWLLNGPHLLTNLQPNVLGELEVMTQLKIPFGCLEIRIEAIALDLTTLEESHKVTIVRTVIPPDLPNLQLDELLGM